MICETLEDVLAWRRNGDFFTGAASLALRRTTEGMWPCCWARDGWASQDPAQESQQTEPQANDEKHGCSYLDTCVNTPGRGRDGMVWAT
jgi:hypothetical protein